jgi:hypothetical protein
MFLRWLLIAAGHHNDGIRLAEASTGPIGCGEVALIKDQVESVLLGVEPMHLK